jgi:hypothetical protein
MWTCAFTASAYTHCSFEWGGLVFRSYMFGAQNTTRRMALLVLLTTATTAHAVTLRVDCSQSVGLNSTSAALRLLQNDESHGPATVRYPVAAERMSSFRARIGSR